MKLWISAYILATLAHSAVVEAQVAEPQTVEPLSEDTEALIVDGCVVGDYRCQFRNPVVTGPFLGTQQRRPPEALEAMRANPTLNELLQDLEASGRLDATGGLLGTESLGADMDERSLEIWSY